MVVSTATATLERQCQEPATACTAALSGTGNDLNNGISGNDGANSTFSAAPETDILTAESRNDVLNGKAKRRSCRRPWRGSR